MKEKKSIENNNNIKVEKTSRSTWRESVAFWFGLIGGIVGILGGGIALWDRWVPPKVNVLGILPVYVYSEPEFKASTKGEIKKYKSLISGVSVIVHLKNGSRTVYISGIDISGKLKISLSDYLFYRDKVDGVAIKKINKEYEEKKPYTMISWSGWPSDGRLPVKVDPHQERFICFNILKPGHVYGLKSPVSDYMGFESGGVAPKRDDPYPRVLGIFKERNWKAGNKFPSGLRDELTNGLVTFQIRVGFKSVEIPASKIKGYRIIHQKMLNELSAQEIFLRRD